MDYERIMDEQDRHRDDYDSGELRYRSFCVETERTIDDWLCAMDMEIEEWIDSRTGEVESSKLTRLWPITAYDRGAHECMDKATKDRLHALCSEYINDNLADISEDYWRNKK